MYNVQNNLTHALLLHRHMAPENNEFKHRSMLRRILHLILKKHHKQYRTRISYMKAHTMDNARYDYKSWTVFPLNHHLMHYHELLVHNA